MNDDGFKIAKEKEAIHPWKYSLKSPSRVLSNLH